MNEQSTILRHTMESFFAKMEEFCTAHENIEPVIWAEEELVSDKDVCYMVFLNVSEAKQDNMMNRMKVKRLNDKGVEVEVLVKPPLTMGISFSVVFDSKEVFKRLELLGDFYSFIRDNNELPVGEYDWVGNEGAPILVKPLSKDDVLLLPKELEKLTPYSIFLYTEIGIDSPEGEEFKRVQRRDFTAVHKNE